MGHRRRHHGPEAAELPVLSKREEKERRRAGFGWGWGGATAAATVHPAVSGGLFASLAHVMAGATTTLLGQAVVAAAALGLAGAAGWVGYSAFGGGAASGKSAAAAVANLGGIFSTLKVREPGKDRLGFESKGEIASVDESGTRAPVRLDPQTPAPAPAVADKAAADRAAADKAASDKAASDKAAAEKAAADSLPAAPEQADAGQAITSALRAAMQDTVSPTLAGSQLSLGSGNAFGAKNIFGGKNGPQFDAGMSKVSVPTMSPAKKGNLSAMSTPSVRGGATGRTIEHASSVLAMGQLKFASKMSAAGAASNTTEAAEAASQGAFDQQQTVGAVLTTPGAPSDTLPTVNPPSNPGSPGSPGSASPGPVDPTTIATPPSQGADQTLENTMNQINGLITQSQADKKRGQELLIMGAILIAIGAALLATMFMAAVGAALIAAGIAMLMMGNSLLQKSQQESSQASQLGQQLASTIDNQQQGAAVTYCVGQAEQGVPPASCQVPDSITNAPQDNATDQSGIQQIQNEENATYTESGGH